MVDMVCCLSAEAVQGAALSLEGMDNVQSSHGLSASMLSVGDSVSDNVLQEHLEHTSSLFVDQARDTLDTTSAGETSDGWLGDTLDVITKNFAVTLGTTLS